MRANKLIILPILAVLIIANMGAIAIVRAPIPPPEYLYVNSFDATYVDWTAVGASPYLDAPGDGSYIAGDVPDGSEMGMFGFEDIAPLDPEYAIDKVWLEGYTDGPYTTDVDFDVYSGAGWLGSLYANDAPQWLRMRWIAPDSPTSDADPNLKSEAGLNAWTCSMYYYDPGDLGVPEDIVDSLRLYVTYKLAPPPPVPFFLVDPEVSTAEVYSFFDVEIIIPPDPYTPVYDLYGYEFKLAYDPDVLAAQDVVLGDFFPPDAIEWFESIDNEAGVVWYSVTMPFGAPKGVSGTGVLAVITFRCVGEPESNLELYDTMMGNRYGIEIIHLAKDGMFESLPTPPPPGENFAVCLKTAFAEHRKFKVSKDEDGFQTLSASIKNYGDWTYAFVEFEIFDGMGAPVTTLYTARATILPGELMSLDASWNGYSVPEDYGVEARVYYMDNTGAWLVGRKGDPSGDRDLMTIGFTVEP